MNLTIFVVFLAVSFIFIAIGLFRNEHSEMALIGFVFLFLLGIGLNSSNITEQTGTNIIHTYTYIYPSVCGVDTMVLDNEVETQTKFMSPVIFDGITQHTISYYFCIAAITGFIAVIIGLGRGRVQ